MTSPMQTLRAAIDGRHPLIQVMTHEEGRLAQWLGLVAAGLEPPVPLYDWTCTRGIGLISTPRADQGDDLASGFGSDDGLDPIRAVQAISEHKGPGIYLFKDLMPFLDQPQMVRALKDAYWSLVERPGSAIVMCSPQQGIPATLRSNLLTLELPPPGAGEIDAMVRQVWGKIRDGEPSSDLLAKLRPALSGLALEEVRHVVHRLLASKQADRETLLSEVAAAKQAALGGTSLLTFYPDRVSASAVGGLHALKDWIGKRAGLFTQRAVDSGQPVPKGVLLMGISGCGKSLAAKLIAHAWRVPLFRLDLNLVYGAVEGSPQASFHKALRTVESVAPAVLWIDEIENGLGVGGSREDTANHILSAFLTWMQEKPPLVFVAATANRIDALPAEMIRKGRFDEVFFCDLPQTSERAEIFAVCIRGNHADPATFDLERLARDSHEWNAAEIEQAVIAGRIDADRERQPFGTEHILVHARHLVPLAKTMSEQILYIRNWAWGRAIPASGEDDVSLD